MYAKHSALRSISGRHCVLGTAGDEDQRTLPGTSTLYSQPDRDSDVVRIVSISGHHHRVQGKGN